MKNVHMARKQDYELPISQRQLAAYLGITGSTLSMTSTGRHGTRTLGHVPAQKLAGLLAVHGKQAKASSKSISNKPLQSSQSANCSRLAKRYTSDANVSAAQLPMLERKLAEMKKKEAQDMHWLKTLDHLIANLPKNKETRKDLVWLQYQQVTALERLNKNGPAAQIQLQVKIDIEKAMVKIYREAVKKLGRY